MSETPNSSNKKPPMPLGTRIIIATVVSVVFGLIGGFVAHYLEAPFYFGFFFMVVLVGMITMFILAAQLESEQNQ
ncbi:MAG: hypothetical protein OHK0029_09380 [Armatimonadaceae bacterium]